MPSLPWPASPNDKPRSRSPSDVRPAARQVEWLPYSAKSWLGSAPGGAPSTETTPPTASDPHKADCGPRTTSIRLARSALSSSNRGSLPAAGSLARMPSTNSKLWLASAPRILSWVCEPAGPLVETAAEGTSLK